MKYLSNQEILYIHSRIVSELEGKQGIFDLNTIKKANKFIRDDSTFTDKFQKTGALFFAIAKKKPFNDLNIITAISVSNLLLKKNGYELDVKNPKLENFIKNKIVSAKLEDIYDLIKDISIK